MQLSNGLYIDKTYEILPDFHNSIEWNFQPAQVKAVDFANNAEIARQEINEFVESSTDQRIRDLFSQGTIRPDTKLILANAVYFKADWERQFDPQMTSFQPFFQISSQQPVNVPLMHKEGNFYYLDSQELNAQILELQYRKGESSFIVVLPKLESSVQEVQELLNPQLLDITMRRLFRQKVKVFLPKLKMERSYDLTSNLQNVGVWSAFSDLADFSGISQRKDLKISRTVHKVFFGREIFEEYP